MEQEKGDVETMLENQGEHSRRLEERIQTSTVIFVPTTKGGQLIKMLKDREERMNCEDHQVQGQVPGGRRNQAWTPLI